MKKYIGMKALLLVVVMMIIWWSTCSREDEGGNLQQQEQTVVMLSMDGFRWDYAQRVATPNLDQMAQQGVMARQVIPAFPS
ncbi:MAG: alkaline phosphatase family protein, partial [Bacteroidales bacterium]